MNAIKNIAIAILAAVACGCATKTRNIELDGMYLNETGTLAIGSVDIQAAPIGEESASIKYTEDNAWLQPSMKLHEIKVLLTGTNSTQHADSLVKSICEAFVVIKNTSIPTEPKADTVAE